MCRRTRLLESFDMIVGTSTGALLGTALRLGFHPREVRVAARRRSSRSSRSRRSRGRRSRRRRRSS